jgi:hypothetical protein
MAGQIADTCAFEVDRCVSRPYRPASPLKSDLSGVAGPRASVVGKQP